MSARIRQTTEQSLVFGHSCEAKDLKEFVAGLPDDAMVSINRYEGDAREPTETTISATWTIGEKT